MNRNKEHNAFMEMLSRSNSTIFKICLLFTDRNPENVKDMYQDIVCELWENWPRFRGESKTNTWVYRIAFNTAISQLRHRSRSPMFSRLDDQMYDTLAEETEDGLWERLDGLIEYLTNEEKEILLLYLDGVRACDIGSSLGITETAVNHRIGRIKEKLKTINLTTDE